MSKPKVGILLDREMYQRVFARKEIVRLKNFAEVQFQEFERLDLTSLKKLVRDTDGVITGWGTPQLTKEILDTAPDLKIIAHSAGSVKDIVSKEAWKRKIVVTTAAPSIAIGVAELTLGLIITGLKRVYTFSLT